MTASKTLIPMLVIVAALLAPSALAAQRPDDRAGARGPGAAEILSTSVRPDDRAGARGPGAAEILSTSVRPDDRTGTRGPGELTSRVVQPASTDFDWGDALIGGFAGIGTTLVLMGLVFLVTSRRSRARTA
jgi:hypothetical protein